MTTKPPPALVGTDALIRIRLALSYLSRLWVVDNTRTPFEALRDLADAINATRLELESLLARGPSIEPRYMLDAEQVQTLVVWAREAAVLRDYRPLGPTLDRVTKIADQVRLMDTAASGEPLSDAVDAYERADLERHARDLRAQIMLMANRLRTLRETSRAELEQMQRERDEARAELARMGEPDALHQMRQERDEAREALRLARGAE